MTLSSHSRVRPGFKTRTSRPQSSHSSRDARILGGHVLDTKHSVTHTEDAEGDGHTGHRDQHVQSHTCPQHVAVSTMIKDKVLWHQGPVVVTSQRPYARLLGKG